MLTHLAATTPRPWDDIPGVAIVTGVIGIVLILAAIRAMIKKGK